jgi:peptide/nickel transport system ATP-binding protein
MLLAIHGLTVTARVGESDVPVLRDVALDLEPGRVLGIVGESGAGKTMVGRVVAGALPPGFRIAAGGVAFSGEDLVAMPPPRRRRLLGDRIAFIPQQPQSSLNPVVSIGRQFGEHLAHAGVARGERRTAAMRALGEVGLGDAAGLLARYPFQLSGGMCQRVLIAMAFATNPALIVADEPTTALDVTTQVRIVRLIRELQTAHGTGLVFITHDLRLAAHLCDDVLVMRAGEILERGPARTIFTAPSHPYTQSLRAANPSLTGDAARASLPAGAASLLRFEGVGRVYRSTGSAFGRRPDVVAVRAASFAVAPGEFVGLVGESGSGKSTIARLIMGLDAPSTGTIARDGAAQIVFQDPSSALNPRRRVTTLVTQALEAGRWRVPFDERRVRADALLTDTGLPLDLAPRYPRQLSGGQRQRVNIARALGTTPRLLVADEIVSGLDVTLQAQIIELLLRLRAEHGIALVFISHDLAVVRALCERVIVLQNGEIVEAGATAEVFAAPQHPYTQALLAAVPPEDLGAPWPRSDAAV